MILILHITTALVTLLYATYIMFSPSQVKIRFAYLLTIMTTIGGILLGIEKHANLTQTCISGSMYLGFVITALVIAHRKLALKINR